MKRVSAAIIEKEGKILVTQRASSDKLALKWEFPGGKVEEGETPEQCLVREIKEELNLDITVKEHFMDNCHGYENGEILLMCYFAEIIGGELRLNVHEAFEWVARTRFSEFDFAPADIKVSACLSQQFCSEKV